MSRFSFVFLIIAVIVFFYGLYFYFSPSQRQSTDKANQTLTVTPVEPTAEPDVFSFEKLNNGYTRAYSEKYKFSFEFSSELQYYPPWKYGGKGFADSIGFHTEKRMKNNTSSTFVFNFSPTKNEDDVCTSYLKYPNWTATSLNGYQAVESKGRRYTIIVCSGAYKYSFEYNHEYTPLHEGGLSESEILHEKEMFSHILNTFRIVI